MHGKSRHLLRQQYRVPRSTLKKLRDLSRHEGVSIDEIARRAIDAYTSDKTRSMHEDERLVRALLKDIHVQVRGTLKRIDAGLAEIRVREQALANGAFRARVRKESRAWFDAHPHEARAIARLFMQE